MAVIAGVIDGAATGDGSVLLVRGEPGIGKSYLLAGAAGHARSRGALVLSTVGVPAEAHLPFAGLYQLLRPLLGRAAELPEPQRAAIDAAFGLAPGPQNQFFIALAALELLADAAARTPVLVLADDLQWLDQATGEVLAFIARRIGSEPIALIAATRTGHRGGPQIAGAPELTVSGLDDGTARELLDRNGAGLAPATRERVLAGTR